VRALGDNVSVPWEVQDRVPLASIPEFMCALGYYPSQAEVTDMISSLAYTASLKKEPKPTSISLERLLYLYYNFSPVIGVRACCHPVTRSTANAAANHRQSACTALWAPA
jgi:hypothetical protein